MRPIDDEQGENATHFEFYALNSRNDHRKLLGKATGHPEKIPYHYGVNRVGLLYLPPEQKVYKVTKEMEKFLVTSISNSLDVGVTYKPVTGPEVPVYVRMAPDSYEMLAAENGEVKSVVHFRPGCVSSLDMHICMGP